MPRILIVEDNPDLAFGLRHNLEFEGYDVLVAPDGPRGLVLARTSDADLMVLDLMLPGMDGYAVLRTLRDEGITTPVLILTARGEEGDKLRGFRAGADDYVTKPFGVLELIARIEALLRRSPATNGAARIIRFGDVEVDLSSHSVRREGEAVSLAPKEYDLLVALLQRRGAVASRQELMREVWSYEEDVISRTVDTHMAELRRKLELDAAQPQYLLTVRKAGYRFATG